MVKPVIAAVSAHALLTPSRIMLLSCMFLLLFFLSGCSTTAVSSRAVTTQYPDGVVTSSQSYSRVTSPGRLPYLYQDTPPVYYRPRYYQPGYYSWGYYQPVNVGGYYHIPPP